MYHAEINTTDKILIKAKTILKIMTTNKIYIRIHSQAAIGSFGHKKDNAKLARTEIHIGT
jgi:hypothetical protein